MNSLQKRQTMGRTGLIACALAAGTLLCPPHFTAAIAAQSLVPIPADVTAPARALGEAFAAVAAHVKPAVVSVYSEKIIKLRSQEGPSLFDDDLLRQFFGNAAPAPGPNPHRRQREFTIPQHGMGSGMIIDKQGHVLTNFHVVRDVDEIKIELADKRQFQGEVVGTDPKTDVAVIKIKGNVPDDLPIVELSDSDKLRVGELVMAIGAPFGLMQTVTTGIISAKGRADVGISDYEDFLQTDAPINPGNSGGPLVNMNGEVIGMNSAIVTSLGQSAGVGFAIPVTMIREILPTLVKGEKVTRGMLGVVIQDLNRDLAKNFKLMTTKGALVAQVNRDSPAEQAGIKVGDVITRFNKQDVPDTRHLRNMLANAAPGSKANVDLIRDGKEESLAVTVGKLTGEAMAGEQADESMEASEKLGFSVKTLTPDLAKQFDLGVDKGVVITDVADGSLAALAGLRAGDAIVETDHQPVTNIGEFERALARNKDEDGVLLRINRQGGNLFVVMQKK